MKYICIKELALIKKGEIYEKNKELAFGIILTKVGNDKIDNIMISEKTLKEYFKPMNDDVKTTKEKVNSPSHYNSSKIECIDYIEDVLGKERFEGYCLGNAIKYIHRAGKKGDKATDLKKALWHLERLVK